MLYKCFNSLWSWGTWGRREEKTWFASEAIRPSNLVGSTGIFSGALGDPKSGEEWKSSFTIIAHVFGVRRSLLCIFSDIFFSKLHSSSFLLCTIRTFFRRNENGNGETYFFRREKNHLGKINEGAFFIYAISFCAVRLYTERSSTKTRRRRGISGTARNKRWKVILLESLRNSVSAIRTLSFQLS